MGLKAFKTGFNERIIIKIPAEKYQSSVFGMKINVASHDDRTCEPDSPRNNDLASSLVLYDTEKNEMLPIKEDDTLKYMETFPEWSPDGKYLYYCRANQVIDSTDFKSIKYNLVRKSFEQASMSIFRP